MPKATQRIVVQVGPDEYANIKAMAVRLTAGNVSGLIRRAVALIALEELKNKVKAS